MGNAFVSNLKCKLFAQNNDVTVKSGAFQDPRCKAEEEEEVTAEAVVTTTEEEVQGEL